MPDLNAEQLSAVTSPAPRLRVLAGAGSGKTRVLVERARAMLAEGRAVQVLAFTRSAVREIRERLSDPPVDGWRIGVDTHHGLALRILQQAGCWGTVIDEVEAKAIEKQAKARGEDPARLRAANGLMLYNELIPRALDVLAQARADGDQDEPRDILVDEAHDCTAEEWALVRALPTATLTIVGDPAQRVFGWRGAVDMPSGALWQTIALPTNYRSRDEVLAAANRLQVPGAVELVGVRGDYGDVLVCQYPNEEVMIDQNVARAQAWQKVLAAGSLGRRAILGRTRRRLETFVADAELAGIPCYAPSLRGREWDRPVARHLLDHLRVVANPHDSLHLERCLQQYAWWDATAINLAELARAQAGCSLWDLLCGGGAGTGSDGLALVRLLHGVGEAVLPALSVARLLAERLQPGWADVAELIPAALSLDEFFAWLADPDHDPAEGEVQGDRLWVGTVHAAKGREWDHVTVLGCEEGAFPLRPRGSDPAELADQRAEERRLAYVALTRARDSVALCWARQRAGWAPGSLVESQPAAWLAEVAG